MSGNSSENVSDECDRLTIGYFVAGFYLLLSIPGIISYSFTLIVLIWKFKQLGSTFYLLAITLAFHDILTLLLTAFYGVPSILYCSFILPFIPPVAIGWLTHFCWYMQITLILIISINRFVCMRSKAFKQYDKLFSTKKMIWCIAGSFLFSLSMILMMNTLSCFSIYNYKNYYFGLVCTNSFYGSAANISNLVICDVIIACTALMYMICWASLKFKTRSASVSSMMTVRASSISIASTTDFQHVARNKAESRLFLQFVVVSSVLVVYELSFYLLPVFVTDSTAITVITGTIYIAVCSMNGYLHIFLNSVIQTEVKKILDKIKELFCKV